MAGPRTRPSSAKLVRILGIALPASMSLLAAYQLDSWVHQHLARPQVDQWDWGRLLRVIGYLPTWWLIAAIIALVGWPRTKALRFALLLALAPSLAGLAGEILKLPVRQERPIYHDGLHVFRPWSQHPWSTSGLEFPSTHVAVAFAAMLVLGKLFPRAWPIWIALGFGCAWTRLASQAHFLSDIVGAAIVAWVVVRWLAPKLIRQNDPNNPPLSTEP